MEKKITILKKIIYFYKKLANYSATLKFRDLAIKL